MRLREHTDECGSGLSSVAGTTYCSGPGDAHTSKGSIRAFQPMPAAFIAFI